MQFDQLSRRGRAFRRHRRQVMVARAFDMYFYGWGYRSHWQEHRYSGYERMVGADKHLCQDVNRYETLQHAKQAADNMRLCSCFMCSGYKDYEKTPRRKREEAQDRDDLMEVTQTMT